MGCWRRGARVDAEGVRGRRVVANVGASQARRVVAVAVDAAPAAVVLERPHLEKHGERVIRHCMLHFLTRYEVYRVYKTLLDTIEHGHRQQPNRKQPAH